MPPRIAGGGNGEPPGGRSSPKRGGGGAAPSVESEEPVLTETAKDDCAEIKAGAVVEVEFDEVLLFLRELFLRPL